MQIVEVNINELKPAEYNPREMTEKQAKDLKKSIEKFGLVDPIIVNSNPERMNVVIGGHQRKKIAEMLGFEKVPVVYLNLNTSEEKELNLRLNKNTGQFDLDLLVNFDDSVLLDVGFNSNDFNLNIDKFDEEEEKPNKGKELTCPECGCIIKK